ncbi:MAG: response regulator [Candidatus Omnitrophica bacterium]|nr:response regulator [Candidatus Omnitrophota bacterium]HOX54044.1 response regulator [Candidatus Omnitrophota bacterium]
MPKYKILICDDELGIRESLKLILEKDYEIIEATNGKDCLENLKNNPVDLILMDIKMPKASGLDILKEIKSINPAIKVIMITGYKSVETATEAIRAGASDYIVKPFSSKDVLEAIRKIL